MESTAVTVEVEAHPAGPPPSAPPPVLADTGGPVVAVLGLAVALTAAGLLLRRLADRLGQGDTP